MKEISKIGAFVLESLTTGMYNNPFDSIREYIQNSADAIISAERQGLLEKNKGLIIITVDPEKRNLTIRDNGIGISSAEVIQKLLHIGMSDKFINHEAGFRGIGRLAGIAYCNMLHFSTSAMYEDEGTIISFDCEKIRQSFSPSRKKVDELQDVLQKHTSQDIFQSKANEHYFEVIMEGMIESVDQFLDTALLEEYLSQVAPVEFDAQQFKFATKIDKFAKDRGILIPKIRLVIKRIPDFERQVFKSYKTQYKTKRKDFNIEIKDIKFFPENIETNSPFWMWYSITDLLGMFDDETVSGIRFRKNNIAIGGPERFSELFPGKEGRLNSWIIGEIQVLSDSIIPNARRDGFEATLSWDEIKQALDPFIKDHCKACHDASSAANRPTAKIISSAKSVIDTAKKATKIGLISTDERDALLNSINKEIEKVSTALSTRETQEEKHEINKVLTSLNALKNNLDQNSNFALDKIKSSLDKKQRKILKEVLSIINTSLSDMQCSKSNICLDQIKKVILEKYQS